MRRTWINAFLGMLAVIFGTSVLYLWAAPLTGPVGRNVVFTETSTIDTLGIKGNLFTLHQQVSPPATPGSDDWVLYCLSTGCFIRDDLGNIIGPLGAGGGGGSTNNPFTVRVASTTSITLSGTQTVDGVSVGAGGELVLAKDQAGPTNGIYIASSAGAWPRSTSFDTSGEFVPGFLVSVQSGTVNAGTIWQFNTTAAFTLGTTTPTFGIAGLGPLSERLANKSTVATAVANGYVGADAAGNVAYNRIGSFAQHTALATGSSITVSARQMGIEGSGAPVDLTSAIQMVAGVANQEVTLIGTHATNTVKLDNGNGLRLCGNTGSVIVGLNGPKVSFRYNTTLSVWEQTNCLGLEQVKNSYATIGNAVDEASGVTIGDAASGTYCVMFASTTKCYCASGACDNIVQLSAGKSLLVKKSDGSTLASLANDTGASTGFGTVVDRSVRVTATAGQTIPISSSNLPIALNDETCASCFDTDNMHNSVTNNSRLTFTTGGKYLVICHGRFTAGSDTLSATLLEASLRLNGTTILSGTQRFAPQAPAIYVNPSTIWNFTASDYIEFVVSFDGTGGASSFDQSVNRFPFCEAKQM